MCMCVCLPGGGEVLAVTECVIGDTKYSTTQSRWREGEEGGEGERLHLFARSIHFRHPFTHAHIRVTARMPGTLMQSWEMMFGVTEKT